MKTKKANKEAKKVWKAMRSQSEDRKAGYLIERSYSGQGFCRNCETWGRKARYEGTRYTLFVSDCSDCGKPTFEAKAIAGSPDLASVRRSFLYGGRAEVVRQETEALFAVTV